MLTTLLRRAPPPCPPLQALSALLDVQFDMVAYIFPDLPGIALLAMGEGARYIYAGQCTARSLCRRAAGCRTFVAAPGCDAWQVQPSSCCMAIGQAEVQAAIDLRTLQLWAGAQDLLHCSSP